MNASNPYEPPATDSQSEDGSNSSSQAFLIGCLVIVCLVFVIGVFGALAFSNFMPADEIPKVR